MEKYLSEAYISKTSNVELAVKWAHNEHNLGKTKIFMLDCNEEGAGLYGVVPNNLVKKFKAMGYELLPWTIEKMILGF